MTDAIYLSDIHLTNFRSFGPQAHVPLHPGPGMLVVVGPNGLGKTSLIEAVEWALTGTVRRLAVSGDAYADEIEEALTRHGQRERSHWVQLRFSDDFRVARGYGRDPVTSSIADHLKASTWQYEVRDIASYLAMTHFLSQSAMLRLTSRSPSERWKAFSQPAGLERIDRVLENLGVGNKGWLTRRINMFGEELRAAEVRLLEFRARRARVAEAAAAVAGHELIPPERIVEAAGELLAETDTMNGTRTERPASSAEALSRLHAGITLAGQTMERRQGNMAPARQALALFESTIGLPQLAASLERAITAAGAAEAVTQMAAKRRQDAWLHYESLRGQHMEKEIWRDRLYRRREDQRGLQEAEEECLRRQAQVDGTKTSLATAQEEALRLRAALEEATKVGEVVAVLEREQAVIWQLADEERRWREGLPSLATDRASLGNALDQLSKEKDKVARLRAAHGEAEARLLGAQERLNRLTADVEERARLVAELAQRLHAHDRECPLCKTPGFEEGKLVERARRAIADSDPRVQEATDEVKTCTDTVHALSDQLRAAESSSAALEGQAADLTRRIAEQEEVGARLRNYPLSAGRPLDSLAAWFAERLSVINAGIDEHNARRRQLDGDGTLAQTLATHTQDVARLGERLDEARNAYDAGLRRRDSLRARLQADIDIAGLDGDRLDAAISETQTEIADMEQLIGAADRAIADAERELEQARTAETSAQRACEQQRTQHNAMRDQREAALRRWASLEMPGDPSRQLVNELEADIARCEGALRSLRDRHSELAAHHRLWLESKELLRAQDAVQSVVAEEQATGADDCEQKLKQKIESLKRKQQSWQTARNLVDTVEGRIRERHDSFGKLAIKPLQERVQAFDLAWSAFPELQIALSIERSRSGRELGASVYNKDAAMILSEGQAGVKSLSYLLSASTAYPWSRWRSLLLDDPLQYNDLVHKTAFLDVLRGLIKEKGYQVIMSTHDLEEAQFIGRKCRNADVPFRECRLLAPGDNGVDFRVS